jgi:hypothetical protein
MRVKSKRPDRKSAWLSVYKLTNAGMAAEFLRRHGSRVAATPSSQSEFFPTPSTAVAAFA